MPDSNHFKSNEASAKLNKKSNQLKNLATQHLMQNTQEKQTGMNLNLKAHKMKILHFKQLLMKDKGEQPATKEITPAELNSKVHDLKILSMQLQAEDIDHHLEQQIADFTAGVEDLHHSSVLDQYRERFEEVVNLITAIVNNDNLQKTSLAFKQQLDRLFDLSITILSADSPMYRWSHRNERLRDLIFKARVDQPLHELRDIYVQHAQDCLDVLQSAKNELDANTENSRVLRHSHEGILTEQILYLCRIQNTMGRMDQNELSPQGAFQQISTLVEEADQKINYIEIQIADLETEIEANTQQGALELEDKRQRKSFFEKQLTTMQSRQTQMKDTLEQKEASIKQPLSKQDHEWIEMMNESIQAEGSRILNKHNAIKKINRDMQEREDALFSQKQPLKEQQAFLRGQVAAIRENRDAWVQYLAEEPQTDNIRNDLAIGLSAIETDIKNLKTLIKSSKTETNWGIEAFESLPRIKQLMQDLQKFDASTLNKKMVATIDEINDHLEFAMKSLKRFASHGLCSNHIYLAIKYLFVQWESKTKVGVEPDQIKDAYIALQNSSMGPYLQERDRVSDLVWKLTKKITLTDKETMELHDHWKAIATDLQEEMGTSHLKSMLAKDKQLSDEEKKHLIFHWNKLVVSNKADMLAMLLPRDQFEQLCQALSKMNPNAEKKQVTSASQSGPTFFPSRITTHSANAPSDHDQSKNPSRSPK